MSETTVLAIWLLGFAVSAVFIGVRRHRDEWVAWGVMAVFWPALAAVAPFVGIFCAFAWLGDKIAERWW